jgi:Flp pilus assembly protein protease CpaA
MQEPPPAIVSFKTFNGIIPASGISFGRRATLYFWLATSIERLIFIFLLLFLMRRNEVSALSLGCLSRLDVVMAEEVIQWFPAHLAK